jgi:hypothetical protein
MLQIYAMCLPAGVAAARCRVGIVSIANSAFSINGGTFMAHAGNVVVALLQIVLTRLPMVSYHYQVRLQTSVAAECASNCQQSMVRFDAVLGFAAAVVVLLCHLDCWVVPPPVVPATT